MTEKTVTVVGAGIVGISCAVHLQRAGYRVTVIDRKAPGESCSAGNAGILARAALVPIPIPGILRKAPQMLLDPLGPLFFRWRYLPRMLPWLAAYIRHGANDKVLRIADALADLVGDTVEQHQSLTHATAAQRYVQTAPYLYVYQGKNRFDDDAYAWKLRLDRGVKTTILRGPEVQAFEPALAADYDYAVVLDGHGFSCNPQMLVKSLAQDFAANGGQILRRDITRIDYANATNGMISTPTAKYPVTRLVIAAGAWSSKIAARLGSPVPLEAERGYHITIADAQINLRNPVMCTRGKLVATPMETGIRLAGLVEFGGLAAGPRAKCTATLLHHAQRLFPNADLSRFSEWMGHRPSLPDSLPVIGRSPHYRDVYYAFGHQHVGLTTGPKTGRLITELLSGAAPSIDLTPFRIDRFGCA